MAQFIVARLVLTISRNRRAPLSGRMATSESIGFVKIKSIFDGSNC